MGPNQIKETDIDPTILESDRKHDAHIDDLIEKAERGEIEGVSASAPKVLLGDQVERFRAMISPAPVYAVAKNHMIVDIDAIRKLRFEDEFTFVSPRFLEECGLLGAWCDIVVWVVKAKIDADDLAKYLFGRS